MRFTLVPQLSYSALRLWMNATTTSSFVHFVNNNIKTACHSTCVADKVCRLSRCRLPYQCSANTKSLHESSLCCFSLPFSCYSQPRCLPPPRLLLFSAKRRNFGHTQLPAITVRQSLASPGKWQFFYCVDLPLANPRTLNESARRIHTNGKRCHYSLESVAVFIAPRVPTCTYQGHEGCIQLHDLLNLTFDTWRLTCINSPMAISTCSTFSINISMAKMLCFLTNKQQSTNTLPEQTQFFSRKSAQI